MTTDRMTLSLRWWLAACTVPLVVLIISALSNSADNQTASREYTTLVQMSSDGTALVKDVLFRRFDQYGILTDSFGTIMYFSLLCIGLVIATLVRHNDSFSIQGIDIPVRLLHATIGVIMSYLWVELVLTINELLNTRASLRTCVNWLESTTVPFRPAIDQLSMRPLLYGGPFIDAYARVFEGEQSVHSEHRLAPWLGMSQPWLVIIGMAAAIGLAHACVFVIVDEAELLWYGNKQPRLLVELARWFLVLLIVWPYICFANTHGNQWFSSLAAVLFVVWCYLLESVRHGAQRHAEARAPEATSAAPEQAPSVP